MSGVDDLTAWLGEQLDVDAEAARSADVKQGDPTWWVSPALASGDLYTVRSDRDNAPIARIERLYDDDGHTVVLDGRAVAEFIAAHDPARVLREIDAKREAVAKCAEWLSYGPVGDTEYDRAGDGAYADAAETMLRLLALPYANRPGYAEALAAFE